MKKTAIILIAILFLSSSVCFSGTLEEFATYKSESIFHHDGGNNYSLMGPEDRRFFRTTLGTLEIHDSQGTIYTQDSNTMKIKGFKFQPGNKASKERALRIARDTIIEGFLGMDIQTNVRY